jgi:hypothetical protein
MLVAVNAQSLPPWARHPQVRLAAIVVVAALVALVVWLLVRGGADNGGGTTGANGPSIGPVAATQGRLRSLSIDFGGASRDPAIATLLYGIAALGSLLAIVAVVRL